MADRPLRPATRRSLGEPLPHQLTDRPRDHPGAADHFLRRSCDRRRVSGINPGFPGLFRSPGQVSHVLLTRSPLRIPQWLPIAGSSFDLHALSTPPAFVLSQDQTLQRKDQGPRAEILNIFSSLVAGGWPNRAPASDISCIVVSDISRVQANQDATVRTRLALVAKTDLCGTLFSCQGAESHPLQTRAEKRPPGKARRNCNHPTSTSQDGAGPPTAPVWPGAGPHDAGRASWRSEGLQAGGRRPLMPLSLRCAK